MIFNVKRAPSFSRDTFLLGAALRGADTHIAAAARSGSHHALRERGTTPPGRGRTKMGEEEEGNGAAESIGDGKSGSRAGEGLIRKRGRPGPTRQKKKKKNAAFLQQRGQ